MRSFFSSSQNALLPKRPGSLSMNGYGELACALFIIDLFLSPVSRHHDALANKILTKLLKVAPDAPLLKQNNEFLTPAKYFQALCLDQTKPATLRAFIQALGVTLKHLLIEHILDHPLHYSALFMSNEQPLSHYALEHLPHALNPWLAQALAESLRIEVHQFETQNGKKLAKHQAWSNTNCSNRHLLLHQQGGQWRLSAACEYSAWFDSLAMGPSLQPCVLTAAQLKQYDHQSQAAVQSVKRHQADLLQDYTHHLARWSKFVKKQQWSEDDLMSYYIEHLPTQSYTFFNLAEQRDQTQQDLHQELITTLAQLTTLRLIPDITQKMQHQAQPEMTSLRN